MCIPTYIYIYSSEICACDIYRNNSYYNIYFIYKDIYIAGGSFRGSDRTNTLSLSLSLSLTHTHTHTHMHTHRRTAGLRCIGRP